MIADHHVMIENKKKTVESNIVQSQQQLQQHQQLVYSLQESLYRVISVL